MSRTKSGITLKLTAIMIFLIALGGCAAVHTSIAKKDLAVQTRMSHTFFLDPVAPEQKTIYMNIRNTSDKAHFDISDTIARALEEKGYVISDNPKTAHYWLQVMVLSVDMANPTAAEAALNAGYGGIALGAAVGTATGAALGGWPGAGIGVLTGAAAFGVADTIANAAVRDVTYMAITDVEISERAETGDIAQEDKQQDTQQEVDEASSQSLIKVNAMNKYRTRVVSTANKANLRYEEAALDLTNGVARSISGLF